VKVGVSTVATREGMQTPPLFVLDDRYECLSLISCWIRPRCRWQNHHDATVALIRRIGLGESMQFTELPCRVGSVVKIYIDSLKDRIINQVEIAD